MSKTKRKKKAKPDIPAPETPKGVLQKGWHAFNHGLSMLTENELSRALDLELKGKNRPSYIERIHTRFNNARVSREKLELAEKVEA